MSAHARQLQSAQRAYENQSPPEPDLTGEQAAWAASNAASSIRDDCPGLSDDVLREIEDWLAERIDTAMSASAQASWVDRAEAMHEARYG